MGSVGVVVAHDDPSVAEDVAGLLERAPDLFVAATSLEQARPGNVIVAGGEPLASMVTSTQPLVVLAESQVLRAGRRALQLGARELIEWPGEADKLAGAVRRAATPERRGVALGRVVGVMGARGGLGTSTIAAALAASIDGAIVVDLSPGAGQRSFSDGDPARTLHDLARAHADPPPEAVEAALIAHAGGARCLHGAPFTDLPGASALHTMVNAVRALAPVCVLDLGCIGSESARAMHAERSIVVVGNDVGSVRAALGANLENATFVIRRVRRGGVPVRDVSSALGATEPIVVPHDASLARSVDLGALPSRNSRALKRLRGLAQVIA